MWRMLEEEEREEVKGLGRSDMMMLRRMARQVDLVHQ